MINWEFNIHDRNVIKLQVREDYNLHDRNVIKLQVREDYNLHDRQVNKTVQKRPCADDNEDVKNHLGVSPALGTCHPSKQMGESTLTAGLTLFSTGFTLRYRPLGPHLKSMGSNTDVLLVNFYTIIYKFGGSWLVVRIYGLLTWVIIIYCLLNGLFYGGSLHGVRRYGGLVHGVRRYGGLHGGVRIYGGLLYGILLHGVRRYGGLHGGGRIYGGLRYDIVSNGSSIEYRFALYSNWSKTSVRFLIMLNWFTTIRRHKSKLNWSITFNSFNYTRNRFIKLNLYIIKLRYRTSIDNINHQPVGYSLSYYTFAIDFGFDRQLDTITLAKFIVDTWNNTCLLRNTLDKKGLSSL
jgi:hypothetical protein